MVRAGQIASNHAGLRAKLSPRRCNKSGALRLPLGFDFTVDKSLNKIYQLPLSLDGAESGTRAKSAKRLRLKLLSHSLGESLQLQLQLVRGCDGWRKRFSSWSKRRRIEPDE